MRYFPASALKGAVLAALTALPATAFDGTPFTDATGREVQVPANPARVFAAGFDLPTSLSALELARAIERATDRLAGFGHTLRQYLIKDLSA